MRGITRFSVVMSVGALLSVTIAYFLLYARHQANLRDVLRLSDMRQAENALTKLYLATGSFGAAAKGCPSQGVMLASCDFSFISLDLSQLRDPGRFSYVVRDVPATAGYTIQFTLERKHGSLSAGKHILTAKGIQ